MEEARAERCSQKAESYSRQALSCIKNAINGPKPRKPRTPKPTQANTKSGENAPDAPTDTTDTTANTKNQTSSNGSALYGTNGIDFVVNYQFEGNDASQMQVISGLLQECVMDDFLLVSHNDRSKQILTDIASLKIALASDIDTDKVPILDRIKDSVTVFPDIPQQAYCPTCMQMQEVELADSGWVRVRTSINKTVEINKEVLELIPKVRCKKCGAVFEYQINDADRVLLQMPTQAEMLNAQLKIILQGADSKDATANIAKLIPDSPVIITKDDGSALEGIILVGEGSTLHAADLKYLRLDQLNVSNIKPADFDIKAAERPVYKKSQYTIGSMARALAFCLLWNVSQNRVCNNMAIPNGTFFPMFYSLSRAVMVPLYWDLKHELLNGDVVMCDESRFKITESSKKIDGAKEQSVVVMNTGPLSQKRYCCYYPQEHKTQEEMKRLLSEGDWSYQVLHTDNLPMYDTIAEQLGVEHALCLSHARRQVIECMTMADLSGLYDELVQAGGGRGFAAALVEHFKDNSTELAQDHKHILMMVHLFNVLFGIEREVSVYDMDYENKIAKLRQEKSKPLMEQLKLIVDEVVKKHCNITVDRKGNDKFKGKSGDKLGAAAAYISNGWHGLTLFLNDARLAISTNTTEGYVQDAIARQRDLKHCMSTWNGSIAYWVSMSIARSCYFNGVEFSDYLIWVFEQLLRRMHNDKRYHGKELLMLNSYLMPIDKLDEEHQKLYRTRALRGAGGIEMHKDEQTGDMREYARIELFDDLYEGPFDKIDRSGLSIIDYKLKCLNVAKLSREEAEELMAKLDEKQGKGKAKA